MDKKHLELAHKTLKKLKKRSDDSAYGCGTASFAGVFLKKEAAVYFQSPCHANLSNIGKDSIAVVSLVKLGGCSNKEAQIFYNWLFNDSPWQDIFVLKDAKEVLKLGGVICRTNFPSNLVAGALFATRGLWEHSETIKFFAEILAKDKKLNKNLVLISSMWCKSSFLNAKNLYIIGQTNAGHWPLGADHSKKYISNFVNNRPEKLRKNFCDSSLYRSGGTQCVYPIWGDYECGDGKESYRILLEKLFLKNKKSKINIKDRWGDEYKCVGFRTRKDFIAEMAKVLKEVEKGL